MTALSTGGGVGGGAGVGETSRILPFLWGGGGGAGTGWVREAALLGRSLSGLEGPLL